MNETPLSWRSPKTEVRQSPIHGKGLFAVADIAKGEIVMIKGGHIVSRDFVEREVTPRLGPVEIQIGDDLFIAPVTQEEREGSMLCSNHSCDPNLGLRGNIIFVGLRDIRAGEELTHDWCMTDDDSYEMECKCGSPNCRRILTGKDWQRPELQARYHGISLRSLPIRSRHALAENSSLAGSAIAKNKQYGRPSYKIRQRGIPVL